MLPFSREQFLDVFASYNAAVWPAQIVAYLIGLALVILLLRRSPASDRIIGAGLAIVWLWTGVVYHGLFFSSINKAAWLFGALFVLQGAIFVYVAAIRRAIQFGYPGGSMAWLGSALVAYATIMYPLLGLWTGERYPAVPTFGITPCPLTIFTLGLLLLTVAPVPRAVLVIPLVWSLIGGSAAFALGIAQDWLLLVSGVAVVPLIVIRDRGRARSVAAA